MSTADREALTARIVLRAMLPVMKVLVTDDPAMQRRFQGVNARIQFKARITPDQAGALGEDQGTAAATDEIGACLVFKDGNLTVEQGLCADPDLVLAFGSLAKMNAFFAGKPVLPRIKGWAGFSGLSLLVKVLSLMLGMKILMPTARPTSPAKRRLKVKLAFYMMTTALSQYNKGGDPEMKKWTHNQPDRIYQISVDEGIAAYLRVKGGRSKAGRGLYTRKRPFVHMRFNGVDGAFPVVMNDVDMVTAVRNGYLVVEGSPEYGAALGDFMVRIQNMVT
jgi:hypothetical protein